MSVTSTTAPTRLALNTWQTRNVTMSDSGEARVDLDVKDSAGTATGSFTVMVRAGTADRVAYSAKGEPQLTSPGVTSAGIGAALLTALSSGTVAQRFQAVDDLLQTRGVIPS